MSRFVSRMWWLFAAFGVLFGQSASSLADDVTIGLSIPHSSSWYYDSIVNSVQQKADSSQIDINLSRPTDATTQIMDAESFIQNNVDLIMLSPLHEGVLTNLNSATDAGIGLVAVDYYPVSDVYQAFSIHPDEARGGRELANHISNLEGYRDYRILIVYRGDKSRLIESFGVEINTRIQTNLEIESHNNESPSQELIDVVRNFQPNVIVAEWDDLAIEAYHYAQLASIDGVIAFGVGGTPEGIAAIQNDKLTGTVALHPDRQGAVAVEVAVEIHNGNAPDSHSISIKPSLVTKADLREE